MYKEARKALAEKQVLFVLGLFSRTCPVRMGPGRYEGGNRMASVKEEKNTLVGEEIIREILAQMGVGPQALVTAFRHEEDDEDYAV